MGVKKLLRRLKTEPTDYSAKAEEHGNESTSPESITGFVFALEERIAVSFFIKNGDDDAAKKHKKEAKTIDNLDSQLHNREDLVDENAQNQANETDTTKAGSDDTEGEGSVAALGE